MKKLGLLVKEKAENMIKESLKESASVFIINYSKLPSPDLSRLRQSLKNLDARLFVIKNTTAWWAFKDSGLEGLLNIIEGPCGLVFIKEDPAGVSRVLHDFSRDHEALKIQGGFFKDRLLGEKDIEALAKLPSQKVLRQQVAMTLKLPICGLVFAMKNTLRKFVYCLEQIKDAKAQKEN